MSKNTNITKYIIIVPILFIIITIISMFTISTSLLNESFENELENYTKHELELQKQYIKNQVDSVANYIEYKKTEAPKRLKERLKQRVYMAYNLAENIYNKNKDKLTDKQLQEKIIETIRDVRFGDDGYFFIAHMKGPKEIISKMLPATPNAENVNAYGIKDKDGFAYVQEFEKVAKKQKEGYVSYKWYKLTKKEQFDKISFVKIFEPFNWFIGYGEYLDDIEKSIKNEALNRINLFKYGKNGYIFTIDTKYTLIQHPYRLDAIGKNVTKLDKEQNLIIAKKVVKAALGNKNGAFVEYNWHKPNKETKTKKIAYVKYIKEWDWVIATGIYLEDINITVNDLKDKEREEVNEVISKTLLISTIILIIVTFIALFISRKINKSFLKYEESLKLANSNLEEKVERKTKQLKELNENLEKKIQEGIEELKEKDKTLEHQSKMVALGEMIGNIAHQWRQPLNAISVSASGMKLKKELSTLEDDEFYQITDNIVKNTSYLSQVIEDFKNYIKGEKRLEKFDVNLAIDKSLNIFNSSIYNHKLNIVKNLEEGLVLETFINELIQVLVNILSNAKDALKDNQDEEHRIIEISTYKKNNDIYISIKDSAGGIKDDIIDKIFEPYFTTKDKNLGTGLGLYMAYQIVNESLKADIIVRNSTLVFDEKNFKGAEFIIKFHAN